MTARNISISKIFEKASDQIVTRTKGKRRRFVGINDSLFKVLSELLEKNKRKPESWVLISDDDGKPVASRKLFALHCQACKIAGVKQIRPHDLRHSYASHFMMNGGSLDDLRVLLGHSSPMMSLRYAHLKEGYIESKANTVNFGASDESDQKLLLFREKKSK